MKKHMARALIVCAFAAMAVVPAHADGCNGTVTETPTGHYIDDRGIDDGGVWLYEESNGIPGLQSGGGPSVLGENDSCVTDPTVTPDTLIL